MKRKTINKLLAVAVSAALCIPITFADPISANASISADLPGTGDTDTDTDTDNGSGSVSGNRPSAPSTDSNSGSSASASGSVSSEAAVVNSASASTVVIGNSRVKSTVGGIFTATSVTGTAITTPKDVLASAVGLSDAEIKAGTNVRSYICDNRDKASKAALQSAAETAGKTVAGYVNMDLYSITKRGVVTKITSSSEPVTITFALPGRLMNANHSYSILAIDKDGKTVIMNDVDTDSKTLTINTKVFGAYSIVY